MDGINSMYLCTFRKNGGLSILKFQKNIAYP